MNEHCTETPSLHRAMWEDGLDAIAALSDLTLSSLSGLLLSLALADGGSADDFRP